MLINGEHHHTIWVNEKDETLIQVFDQRYFPHKIEVFDIKTTSDAAFAIKEMVVRGAPLIGVTAAYGMYLACIEAKDEERPNSYIAEIATKLNATRPTAVNLAWAIHEQLNAVHKIKDTKDKIKVALQTANQIKQDDINISKNIGKFGLELIKDISKKKNGKPVNILTHCNAGWLATIDWGTALSPIYHAQTAGIDVHVWVD